MCMSHQEVQIPYSLVLLGTGLYVVLQPVSLVHALRVVLSSLLLDIYGCSGSSVGIQIH